MRISEEELEAMEPVHAACTETELVVTLANGQKVVTPLWWYPRLLDATPGSARTTSCRLSGCTGPISTRT